MFFFPQMGACSSSCKWMPKNSYRGYIPTYSWWYLPSLYPNKPQLHPQVCLRIVGYPILRGTIRINRDDQPRVFGLHYFQTNAHRYCSKLLPPKNGWFEVEHSQLCGSIGSVVFGSPDPQGSICCVLLLHSTWVCPKWGMPICSQHGDLNAKIMINDETWYYISHLPPILTTPP